MLIRQHRLDASLVKQYAAEFCGTKDLRQASREQIQSFITHLAELAARDRESLLCKLNSYASPGTAGAA
jgi:ABC-type transporter MlaC component